MDNTLLTTQESAKKMTAAGLQYSADDVAELARRSVFPGAKKVGNIWQIPVEDIDHFLQQRIQQRKRTRRLQWFSVGSITAILLFIFAATDFVKNVLDLTTPDVISTPIGVASPTPTPVPVGVAPAPTASPTKTSTSTSAPTKLPTAVPSEAPTVTPTPDLSTPKGATKAFLDALKRGDTEQAASLISSYSLSYYDKTTKQVVRDLTSLKLEKFTYGDILDEDIERINDQTVWVHVVFPNKDQLFSDCCVLRQEEGKWKVNLGFTDGSGEFWGILVDELSLTNYSGNPVNNVKIEPIRMARYTRRFLFTFRVLNEQDECITWGTENDIRISFDFGDHTEDIKGGKFFPERYKSPEAGETIFIYEFKKDYPKEVILRHWRLSSSSGCRVEDIRNAAWGYQLSIDR